MTRRCNEVNPKALNIVNRFVQRDDFHFATIARPCIHFADGKGSPEDLLDRLPRFVPDLRDPRSRFQGLTIDLCSAPCVPSAFKAYSAIRTRLRRSLVASSNSWVIRTA